MSDAAIFATVFVSIFVLRIIAATLVLMLVVHVVLTRTRTGKAMRAVSDSPELARLTGIDVSPVSVPDAASTLACLAIASGIILPVARVRRRR